MVKIFLAGDVMTGRGIDQILRVSVDPFITESYMRSADGYVSLAEQASGPIPREVGDDYPWGDALEELGNMGPEVRLINLETAVTSRGDPWPSKGISYRMHPGNVGVLSAASIDVCALANNHVLDWSYEGLEDTLDTLRDSEITYVGAGRSISEAETPAIVELTNSRVIVIAVGSTTSGIPPSWAASDARPGVAMTDESSMTSVDRLEARIADLRRPGDVVVCSIHWGGNWGHDIPRSQRSFAHRLIERGVDVVHGHSSHHPKAIEVYRNRPILYGCGDLINDYEGISGHDHYRPDLSLMYFVDMGANGLEALEMTPMRMHRFRCQRVEDDDVDLLAATLNEHSSRFDTRFTTTVERRLRLAL